MKEFSFFDNFLGKIAFLMFSKKLCRGLFLVKDLSGINDIAVEHHIYSGLLISERILMVWLFICEKIALSVKLGIFLDLENFQRVKILSEFMCTIYTPKYCWWCEELMPWKNFHFPIIFLGKNAFLTFSKKKPLSWTVFGEGPERVNDIAPEHHIYSGLLIS